MGAGEEEGAAGEGAVDEGFGAMGELEEDAVMEEPGCVGGGGEGEVGAEGGEVAFGDGGCEGGEVRGEWGGAGEGIEVRVGEAAEGYVGGDEIGEDEAFVGGAAGVTLVVGGLEGELGAVEVVVGEVVAAQVVEIGDALGGWEERERRGLLVDVAEDLLGAAEFAAVEEELETEVGGHVDADAAAFGLAVLDAVGLAAGFFAEALFEGFADGVGGAFDKGNAFGGFVTADAGLSLAEVGDEFGRLSRPIASLARV